MQISVICGLGHSTRPVLYLDCGVNCFYLFLLCLKRGQLSWGREKWKWEGLAILGHRQ